MASSSQPPSPMLPSSTPTHVAPVPIPHPPPPQQQVVARRAAAAAADYGGVRGVGGVVGGSSHRSYGDRYAPPAPAPPPPAALAFLSALGLADPPNGRAIAATTLPFGNQQQQHGAPMTSSPPSSPVSTALDRLGALWDAGSGDYAEQPASAGHRAVRHAAQNRIVRSSWDYEAFPWYRVFHFFADNPGTYELLRQVCVEFRTICQSDHMLRAAYFVKSALTLELMDSLLLEQGAVLPKRLVEAIFKEQQFIDDETVDPQAHEMLQRHRRRQSTSRVIFNENGEEPGPAPPPTWSRASAASIQLRKKRPLPHGSLEYIVAYGFKCYADTLILDLPTAVTAAATAAVEDEVPYVYTAPPSAQNASALARSPFQVQVPEDDATSFHRALSHAHPDMETLRHILFDNNYIPALDRPTTPDEWDDFWFKCLKILRDDAEMGRHVYRHSGWQGLPAAASDALVARALRDPTTTSGFLKFLASRPGGGHRITREACVRVLASPTRLSLDSIAGLSALDLLRSCVPGGDAALKGHARAALAVLFRDGRRDAVRAVDNLLMEFELGEDDVGMAFLADGMVTDVDPDLQNKLVEEPAGLDDCIPFSFSSLRQAPGAPGSSMSSSSVATGPPASPFAPNTTSSLKSPLPFMTALGQVQGGMTDMLWQLVLARYGVNHPFAAACVVDVIIGGTLKNPIAVPAQDGGGSGGGGTRRGPRSRYSVMMVDPAAASGGGRPSGVWIDEDHDDRDRDTAARDTIEALLDGAGVPIDPGMLAPISKAVLVLRLVRPRVLEFMTRIERNLLQTAFDPNASEADRLRWSRVRWVAALRRHVIDHRAFLEHVLSPSELAAMDEQRRSVRKAPERTSGIFSGKMFAALPQVHANPTSTAADSSASAAASAASANGEPSASGEPAAPQITASAIARTIVGGLVRSARPRPSSAYGSVGALGGRSASFRRSTVGSPTSPSSTSQTSPSPPPPVSPSSAASGSGSGSGGGGVASPFARMLSSVVDLVDREFAEVRRFHASCEELVALLEAPRPGVQPPQDGASPGSEAATPAVPPPPPDSGPFSRWLRDADARAAAKAARDHARTAQLQLQLQAQQDRRQQQQQQPSGVPGQQQQQQQQRGGGDPVLQLQPRTSWDDDLRGFLQSVDIRGTWDGLLRGAGIRASVVGGGAPSGAP